MDVFGQRISHVRVAMLAVALLLAPAAYVMSRAAMAEHESLLARSPDDPREFARLVRAVAVVDDAAVWHHTTRQNKKTTHHYVPHVAYHYAAHGRLHQAVNQWHRSAKTDFTEQPVAEKFVADLPALEARDRIYYDRYEDVYLSQSPRSHAIPPGVPDADATRVANLTRDPFVVYFDRRDPSSAVALPDETIGPYEAPLFLALIAGPLGLATTCFTGKRGLNPVRRIRDGETYRLSLPSSVAYAGKVSAIVALIQGAVVFGVLVRYVHTSGLISQPFRHSEPLLSALAVAFYALIELPILGWALYNVTRSLAVSDPTVEVRAAADRKGRVRVFETGRRYDITVRQPMWMALHVNGAGLTFKCTKKVKYKSGKKTRTKTEVVHEQRFEPTAPYLTDVRKGDTFEATFRVDVPSMGEVAANPCTLNYQLDLQNYPDYEIEIPISVGYN